MKTTIYVTETIRLTPFNQEDKNLLVQYLNDPVIYKNTSHIPSPYTEKDAEAWLKNVAEKRESSGTEAAWVVRHQKDGLMGGIGRMLKSGPDGHADEIGYWLAAPFRGQGIMTAVVRRYSDWLFENHPRLVRIEANVFSYNEASVHILEKTGFEREGISRKMYYKAGTYIDAIRMAKIRKEPDPVILLPPPFFSELIGP